MDPISVVLNSVMQLWFVLPIFLLVALVKSRWFKGKWGEFLVNRMLTRLEATDYTVIDNITLPTEDGTTQIDHIVVSKFGLFVIETKNLQGWIFGSAKQKMWTQQIYKHKSKFQNPLHQNYKHVKTIQQHLECPDEAVQSLIIFIGDSTFKTDMPENVTYASNGLKFIKRFDQAILSDDQVKTAIEQLNAIKLKPGLLTDYKHRQHVKAIVQTKEQHEQTCPKCGSAMIQRETKRGVNAGKKFWGCSQFPKCRAIG